MGHKCEICNRGFDSEESLKQHNHAKHSSSQEIGTNKPLNLKKYLLIGAVILAVVLIVATFYIRNQKPGAYDSFAKCLSEKGAVVYGNDFCQYTNKQLNLFGKSDKYLSYVRCLDNEALCDSKKVEITPTWEINNQTYSGVQSFEKLSELSGCVV